MKMSNANIFAEMSVNAETLCGVGFTDADRPAEGSGHGNSESCHTVTQA